jgi:uncharacterized protein
MTGGTGFVGKPLAFRLIQERHEVTVLTRSLRGTDSFPPGISFLQADPAEEGPWQDSVRDQDVLINLAGASIFSKWTDQQKRAIRDSRVHTTRNLVEAMPHSSVKRLTLFSTSAVGYYGFQGDEELTEESPPGNDFLARVAIEWEEEALRARQKGARVVLTRFGIVLGDKGGALSQMIPLFRRFVGGPLGTGWQWFSWIHLRDLIEAFVFLMNRADISGPVNLCSPHPVRNRTLARALGKALHRPHFMPAPGFMIRLVLGEFGSVILEGQRVIPRKLLTHGFVFRYPDIDLALASIVHP